MTLRPASAPNQETVPCELCGAPQAERFLAVRDWDSGAPEEFWLVRCPRCGLLYLNPRPTPTRMAHYYPPGYASYRPRAIEDERWKLLRWMRRQRVGQRRRLVEQFSADQPGRLLDVGCSTGIFLADARDHGWAVHGVEPSPDVADYPRRRFGIPVFGGTLEAAGFASNWFDAVTLWDVLEHTHQPLATLGEVRRILQPGGVVALSVPNFRSLDRLVFGQFWIGYDAPRHLYVFSTDTLRALLSKAGFEVLCLRAGFGGYFGTVLSIKRWANHYIQSRAIQRALYTLLDAHGARLPVQPVFSLLDWMGWGNELVGVARKPLDDGTT